jgi:hypothetical protein
VLFIEDSTDSGTEMSGSFTAGDLTVDYVIAADSSEVAFSVSAPVVAWISLGVSTDGSMTSGGDGAVQWAFSDTACLVDAVVVTHDCALCMSHVSCFVFVFCFLFVFVKSGKNTQIMWFAMC